jgi:erythromycin esterase-like protein
MATMSTSDRGVGSAARRVTASDELLVAALASGARPFSGAAEDLDPLLELTRDARCVLIGEATHGTQEFYRRRAQITQRLISEQGFVAIAAEADWPDAYRVNRFVRGLGNDANAVEALADFRRFPAWMWRNAEVLDFIGWLRDWNDARPALEKVGFYGLDLYSLHASISAVLAYLDKTDPVAAERARSRYACFEDLGEDPERYAHSTGLGLSADCEREVVAQVVELRQRRHSMLLQSGDGLAAEDEHFQAEQNALVVRDAEKYYRSLFGRRASTWNLRDTHMADTLASLMAHYERRSIEPKIVIWAHNSHVGDARATSLGAAGEINIGQLVRERYGEQAVLIGFSTYTGTVTAASDWGRPAERKQVKTAVPPSYEELFHRLGKTEFLLRMRDLAGEGEARAALEEPRLQRAIGVVYRPETERVSHYFRVVLPRQFDAIIHVDRTRALEPLERLVATDPEEAPETFPTGM